MSSHQGVQLAHASEAINDPAGGQHSAVLVEQAQAMVALAPVHPKEQHRVLLCSGVLAVSQRRTCGALMAVLTWHDIPPAVRPPQHRPGHGLPQELNGSEASECSPAGGSAVASHRRLCGPISGLPPDPPPPKAWRRAECYEPLVAGSLARCERNVTAAQAGKASSVADGS
jgi:hypothetical protein